MCLFQTNGTSAIVTKPAGAAHTAGTALTAGMAVATLADCTCSVSGTSRTKLARVTRCACTEGVPSMVMVQPCCGVGQCAGCRSPDHPQRFDLDDRLPGACGPTTASVVPATVPAASVRPKIVAVGAWPG